MLKIFFTQANNRIQMKWKKVSDQMPPLRKKILIGFPEYRGEGNYTLNWIKGMIYRPFDRDNEYNPDLYKVKYYDECNPDELTTTLSPYHYWLEISLPEDPQFSEKIHD